MTNKKTAASSCQCECCGISFVSWIKKRFCSDKCRLSDWRYKRGLPPKDLGVDGFLTSGFAKTIPEANEYAITRNGRVFSKATSRDWRELRPGKSGSRRQYLTVVLKGGIRWDIHRLIAHVFIGECPSGELVRHLDGNPSNNVVENLAYGTHKQNMSDAIIHGTTCRGARNARSILDEPSVEAIRRLHATDMLTMTAIGALFDVSVEAVSQIIRGTRWDWSDESKRS